MKITLEINDSKASAFLNFIGSLDFIQIQSKEDDIEPTKQEVLAGIKKGIKEAQQHDEGKIALQSARDFINEL